MLVDIDYFPIVWLRDKLDHDHDGGEERKLLNNLLDRRQRFVIIAERPPFPSDFNRMTRERKEVRAKLFRERKKDFQAFCAGMIIVGLPVRLPAPIRSALKGLRSAMGVPMFFAENELVALELARERLKDRQSSDSALRA